MACLKSLCSSCLHLPIHQGLILRKGIKKIDKQGDDRDSLIIVWLICYRVVSGGIIVYFFILKGIVYFKGM